MAPVNIMFTLLFSPFALFIIVFIDIFLQVLTDRKGEPTDVSKANSQGYLNMFVLSIIDYKGVLTSVLDKISYKQLSLFLFYQGVLFSSSVWVYFSLNTSWPGHRDTGNSSYCDISHLCKSFLDKHTNEIYELSMPSFQAGQDSSIGDLDTQQAGTTCGAFSQRIRPRIIFSYCV